jgi:HSP20 family protein
VSIQRWDPLRDIVSLREAMNSLLEESFVRPRAGMAAMSSGMVLDLRETDDAYVVETVLPGVKSDQVDISVLGDQLRISAEVREESAGDENDRWLIRERRFGRFERALTLPNMVKADEAEASFSDGILRITLPKAEQVRPRSIQVKMMTEAGTQAQPEIDTGGSQEQGS